MKTLTFDPSLYVVVPRDFLAGLLLLLAEGGYRVTEQTVRDLLAAPPMPEQPQGDEQMRLAAFPEEAASAVTAPAQGDDKQVLDWINKDWVPDPEPPTGNDARFIRAAGAPAAISADVSGSALRKGDYVLATKYSDGDPGDAWCVGYFDGTRVFSDGGTSRHMIVNGKGECIRAGGYRRVGKIRKDVGAWLLTKASAALEASPPGTVNLWTMLTPLASDLERDATPLTTENAGASPPTAQINPSSCAVKPTDVVSAELRTRALTFDEWRKANVTRCLKWHPQGLNSWSASDWITAIVGELGELAGLIKMRNRERDGLPGNKFSPTNLQVANEAADVFAYLDLFCAAHGIDLAAASVTKFNEVSERVGFPDRIEARALLNETKP